MKVGEVIAATVKDINSNGRAVIAHPNGTIVFVLGAWHGEEITAQITEVKGRYANAKLESIITPSPNRRQAPCQYHGVDESSCGGCLWQFVQYDAQLEVKQQRLEHAITKVKKHPNAVQTIIASQQEFGYRNRAQLKSDGAALGFMANNSRHLIAVDDCIVLDDKNRSLLRQIQRTLPNEQLKPSAKNTKKLQWTTVNIDSTSSIDNYQVNRRTVFQQAHSQQNEVMRQWLKNKLGTLKSSSSNGQVLELFCGSGNFTEVIAELNFPCILAVEGSEQAIQTLSEKRLENCDTLVTNLYAADVFEKIYRHCDKPGILVLDPPREGLKNSEGLFRKKRHFDDIIYISCDLATFVRDARYFNEHGFILKTVQAVDQFPQTPHVEIMSHFTFDKRLKKR